MTNRDKLNKKTNEDAVKEYYDKIVCPQCDLQCTEECETCTGKEKLINWLSQEAEEDKKTCGNCKFHKKVEPCIGAIDKKCVNPKSESCGTYTMNDCSCNNWEVEESWGIDKNHTLATNIQNKNDYLNYGEAKITVKDWNEVIDKVIELNTRLDQLEEEGKKSADEMFEELGYKRNDYGKYSWSKYEDFDRYEVVIYVEWVGKKHEHITFGKFRWDKKINFNFEGYITEAEDKAIHKKIKELKG